MDLEKEIDGGDGDRNLTSYQFMLPKLKKLTGEELLEIFAENTALRGTLILLIMVLIVFAMLKNCRLASQLHYSCQKKNQERKSQNAEPQVVVRSEPTSSCSNSNEKKKWKYFIPNSKASIETSLSNESKQSSTITESSVKIGDMEISTTMISSTESIETTKDPNDSSVEETGPTWMTSSDESHVKSTRSVVKDSSK